MWDEGMESNWSRVAEGVMLEIREWREQHPRANITEIEEAVDGLWSRARARILQDVALASDAKDTRSQPVVRAARCVPSVDGNSERRGQKVRRLFTHHDQWIGLKRSYGVCPACGTGDFPPWVKNWVF